MLESGIPPPPLPLFSSHECSPIILAQASSHGYSLSMYPLASPEPFQFRNRFLTLAEHLGFQSHVKLLIINADDFGLNDNVNRAIVNLFGEGKVSSTTIMVAGAGYEEAAKLCTRNRFPCGIHLSLTSDYDDDGSRPVLDRDSIPTLFGANNRLHPDRDEFFKHALPGDAYLEAVAQIRRALTDGIDVTHIDSHEGSLQLRPEFAEIYLRLASEFKLPVRAGSRQFLKQMGIEGDWVGMMRELGILSPDNLIYFPIDSFTSYEEKAMTTTEIISQIPAGITEIYFHPTIIGEVSDSNNPESHHVVRQWDNRYLMSDLLRKVLVENQIRLVNFSPLGDLMRQA
jgi:chitin disaccharide deacetylase